ncbi:MAG: CRISPR system precrRNA processing endoribonuclease RAMP protein Cas6 [Pseudomonadota bacterium]
MLFGKYHLTSVFQEDAILPEYKGSTLRGVFGIALKRVVCTLKRMECGECLLRERCLYSTVFEAPSFETGRNGPSPPHPFVIEPPLSTQTEFTAGNALDCTLQLFGGANRSLPYFVYAFEQMGRIGLGRRIEGKRPEFLLTAVTCAGQTIYDHRERVLASAEPVDLKLGAVERAPGNIGRITVVLETPLRLKFRNDYQAELPFHVLLRGILRRISSLNDHFADGQPQLDYRGLTARAERVRIASSTIRWSEFRRYSNRQKQAMHMGGMVGEVSYEGDLSEFIPLIRYCEEVHVGKATTFGLGKITVTEYG